MKNLFKLFFLVLLFACQQENQKVYKLNSMSEQEFDEYVFEELKQTKRNNKSVLHYLDSLLAMPNLNNENKALLTWWKAADFFKRNSLDTAYRICEEVYQLNRGKESAVLVSYYYLMGGISGRKNQFYQSVYYYNKAGEILKQTDIYFTRPSKADKMLMRIAIANRELNLTETTNEYLTEAMKKHKKNDDSPSFKFYNYSLKAGIYSLRAALNKNSMDFYINKALALDYKPFLSQINNIYYVKAEYFYNVNEYDSSLYYLNQISADYLAGDVLDEINRMSIYSRQGKLKAAEKEYQTLQEYLKEGRLTKKDSLHYLDNLTDYYFGKKDFKAAQKAQDDFLVFKENFDNEEIRNNISQLSLVMDLQHKDKKIAITESKYSNSVRFRNQIIIIAAFLLLSVLTLALYLRYQATKKQLILQNQATNLKMNLLKSQINPHFIFNTLAAIQSLIRQDKNEESITYLNKFSTLMRQILNRSRDEQTTLSKEVTILREYLDIQKLQKNQFDYTITLADDLEEMQDEIVFPELSLQPFVENSIIHGFKHIDYRGNLTIDFASEGKSIYITIIDNGVGIAAQAALSNQRKSHGIAIIKEQLDILGKTQKEATELKIENRKDASGVLVTIKMPLIIR